MQKNGTCFFGFTKIKNERKYTANGGRHGLEASHEDQSTGVHWGCVDTNIPSSNNIIFPRAVADSNTGAHNTQAIIDAGCGAGGAADVVSTYMGPNGTTTGWYLPNKDELILLYEAKKVVGGFEDSFYYLEFIRTGAPRVWGIWFTSSDALFIGGKNQLNRVRAVRTF